MKKAGNWKNFIRLSMLLKPFFLFLVIQLLRTGAHIRDAIDLKRTMILVVLSLVPCLLFGMWNVGYQHYKALGITDASLIG